MGKTIFTPPGAPSLQMRALEVPVAEILSKETQELIDEMFAVARGERDSAEGKRVMVDLAAPQIGYGQRIILVDVGVDRDRKELGSLVAFINPEIVSYSEEIEMGREGCYSVDRCLLGLVPRSARIAIKAFDRNGEMVTKELSGFTARIFQHEVDHLNGIRFPDRIASEGGILHWVEESEFAAYKKDPEHWNCTCSLELWSKMKNNETYKAPEKAPWSYQTQKEKLFIGLELRTNNEECSQAMPAHKDRFFQENILGKIPNKINGDVIALYTDYEGDCTKPYSWILGCEVSSLEEVPEGLVGKVIPSAKYAVLTTEGEFPQGLIAVWQAVWQSNLARSYTSDFEVYKADFDPVNNPEVKLYIAVE